MVNVFYYSFHDEIVKRFCCNLEEKILEMSFLAYSDILANKYVEEPCTFVIQKWKDTVVKIGLEKKDYKIENQIGIVRMILNMELKYNNLELLVNTQDNRYLTITFIDPILRLEIDKIN